MAILTLALGISASTALFSVIHNVLMEPFPYTDSQRLMTVQVHDTERNEPGGRGAFAGPELLDYAEQNHVFDAVIASRTREVAIWLRSRSVSRRHARIVVSGSQAVLDDPGSKNGTFRRGEKVTAPTPLADGDEIRVGTVAMTFRVIPPEDSTETTS